MKPLDRLARDAAAALAQGAHGDPNDRAQAYRHAAEVLVAAREHFLTDAGEPDWLGRTYAYRVWAGNVYGLSGVSGDERLRTQAAVRYHVGNVLRDRLDEATLADLDLRDESPRERSASQRAERTALLKAVTGSSSGFAGLDALRALTAVAALLERLPASVIAALDADEVPVARDLVKASAGRLDDLQVALSRRRGRRK
jgi:hypothetical protein